LRCEVRIMEFAQIYATDSLVTTSGYEFLFGSKPASFLVVLGADD
jgi:hypothetical protein